MPTKTIQSETKKIPKLRFPGFSGDWEEKKLGDFFEVTSSKRVFQYEWTTSGVAFYRAREIVKLSENGYVDNTLYISNKMFEKYKERYGAPKEGDILVTGVGTIGRAYVTKKNDTFYFKDGNIVWFRNLNLADSQFVRNLFYTRSVKKQIADNASSSTVGTYTIDFAKKTKVTIPAIREQQKIAEFLGATNEWIENLRAQKESFESYKKGIMQKIFSQEIRFKDDKGNEFPMWEEKKLGEVFYSEKGNGLSKDMVTVGGTNECILYGELYTTYREVIFDVSSKTNINNGLKSQIGDLLIPCSTTTTGIDLANITALNKKDILLGGDITVLRSKDKIDNIFYAYYLSNYKKKEIAKYAQGSTIVHLYYNHFKKMSISIPHYKEQQKIAEFLTSIDRIIESKQQQITQAEQWKRGLMQGLFV